MNGFIPLLRCLPPALCLFRVQIYTPGLARGFVSVWFEPPVITNVSLAGCDQTRCDEEMKTSTCRERSFNR
ncbi:hypothetical protein B0T16DRAFT_413812 [Cercophora newfieldiana]|uniref:Secreted protein n=1 Tax=Cercophora newfieldiana TaxID=92897 RepID=A0AA39Y7R6_9PEZI|nr:hypothetical protein B0T16DRAFT_413812 [Cercophora newfieldiana]